MAARVQSFELHGLDALPVMISVDSGMVKVSGGFHADAYKCPAPLLPLCESTPAANRGNLFRANQL